MRSILLVFALSLYVSYGIRKTHVVWWFGKAKGQDNYANEIDGIYRVAARDRIDPSSYKLFRKNSDVLLKYITQTIWSFHRDDIIDPEMFHYENINLVLEGLDTTGIVKFNYQPVGSFDNMFTPHIFHVKNLFRNEYNDLNVQLTPVLSESESLYSKYNKTTKLYPECPPHSYHGKCFIYMLRKMQTSFGSVIGPLLPSMGVWRPAYFEAFNETVFREISTNIEEQSDGWSLNITVFFANNTRAFIKGTVELKILDITSTDPVALGANEDREFVFTKRLKITKEKIELWWPIGYGNQKLYDLQIQFSSGKGEIVTQVLRLGFRKIELVQDKIGAGTSFYFKVNGRPIFMKGTVMAPISLQPELAHDPEIMRKMLSLAVSQNMNMIRIWGGGMYQVDKFYELADELGLLIWQDFMFTDWSYPTNEHYLENVLKEVRYQVRRLSNHPSVAIFCGNDEGELSLAENRYNQSHSKTVREDYSKLFDKTIKTEFLKVTNGKGIFLTSTPSNGELSAPTIAEKPNDPLHGDVHFFDNINDPFKHSIYPIPRFVSAYGIQSIPKMESFLKDTSDPNDLDFDGDFLHKRQHLPDGFGKLKKVMGHQIVLPVTKDKEKMVRALSYYSQVVQAYAMKIQTERYRSHRSIITTESFGNTMGALYWHFNDVWTAPTWSGIDYFGEWKMMQYYVRDFFSPIILTGQFEIDEKQKTIVNIFVVSDIEKIEKAEVKIKLGKWNELGTFSETSFPVTVDADSSKLVRTIDDLKDFFSKRGCTKEDCFFHLSLESNRRAIAPDNFMLPNRLKSSKLGHPKLKLHLRKLPFEQIYEITVTTDKNALFVWLDAHQIDGSFSENGFLQITPTRKVFFYSKLETSEDELREVLTVTHVNDNVFE